MSESYLNIKKHDLKFIIFILLIICLLSPMLFRIYKGNNNLLGQETHYHSKAASVLIRNNNSNMFYAPTDIAENVFAPRNYVFTPHTYVLAYFSRIFGISLASKLLPFIFGVISVVFFNLLLKLFFEKSYQRNIITIFLIVNPAFIYAFTVSNPHSTAIAFTLAATYFFMRPEKLSFVLSVLLFTIVALFSIFNSIFSLLLLLAIILRLKENHNRFIVVLLVLAFVSFARKIPFYYNYTFFPNTNMVQSLFSDLGGLVGFGVFIVMLAIYGVFSHWKKKSKFFTLFAIAILLLVAQFFVGNFVNMYLGFLVSIAAALGFLKLYSSRWKIKIIRNLTLLVLVCGLMFSTVAFLTRVVELEPDNTSAEGLAWMRDNVFKEGYVLSHHKNGYSVSYLARNPVFVDSLELSSNSQDFLYKVADSIFDSRDLEQVKILLLRYGIKYIYIDPVMKEGLVWDKDNQGLLFLLSDKDTFKNIYAKNRVEIWEVINVTAKK